MAGAPRLRGTMVTMTAASHSPPGAAMHAPVVRSAWQRSLPNWLTAGRVGLALLFFGLLTPWSFGASSAVAGRPDARLLLAATIFVVACLTDAADGFLARRWGAVTAFGRIMDPFADKLLVVGAFVYLAGPAFWIAEHPATGLPRAGVQVSGVAPWMVAVLLGRELLVTSIRGVLEAQGVQFPASASGKLKMIAQSIAVPVILVSVAVLPVAPPRSGAAGVPWGRDVAAAAAWVAVLVTLWSGAPYVRRALWVHAEWRRSRPAVRAEEGS